MSSKEQKTPNEQVSEEMENAAEQQVEATQETGEGVDPRVAELEAQLAAAVQR